MVSSAFNAELIQEIKNAVYAKDFASFRDDVPGDGHRDPRDLSSDNRKPGLHTKFLLGSILPVERVYWIRQFDDGRADRPLCPHVNFPPESSRTPLCDSLCL